MGKTVALKKKAAPAAAADAAPAPTSSNKPVAKKQQKQKQPKLMIDSKRQKQEKAESRKREMKEEAHDEEEEDDEEEAEEEEEEEEEESVPRKSSHMGGMRGLMMRGGAEGSSSSDSGGSDDEEEGEDEDEMDQEDDSPPPQKGGKKRLLSTAAADAAADAASKKQASATLKAATTKGAATTSSSTSTTTTSSSSSSSTAATAAVKYDGSYKNRQRVLVFCSRGVTARYRHLLEDLRKLIPHHKKDVKLDCKGDLQVINEIAEVKSCNNSLFLEARKRQDLYLWLSKTPLGPSIKFNVLNVHTLDELRLTGNAMLGSRPLLSFDLAFDAHPHTRLIKALLTDTFGTPRGHPKSKPFVDRVLSFALADGKVWVRNYQIVDTAPVATIADPLATDKAEAKAAAKTAAAAKKKGAAGGEGGNEDELTSLVEIGPRFVLNPIRIFSGSFGGPTLYQNPSFISPNFVRSEKKRTEGARLAHKMKADGVRKERKAKAVLPKDELQELFRVKV